MVTKKWGLYKYGVWLGLGIAAFSMLFHSLLWFPYGKYMNILFQGA